MPRYKEIQQCHHPGKDALCLMFAVDADPENRVMLPGSPQDRIDELLPTPLKEGEVLLYHPETKSFIHFLKDGTIDIDSQKDVNFRVVGNMLVDVEGNLTADVEGNIDLDAFGTAIINSVGKTTVKSLGTVEIDGNALVDLLGTLIKASDGGTVESLCNEAFLAKFNSHSHPNAGANDTTAVIGTDTTSVLKGE